MPSMIGESWFGVERTASPVPSQTSQLQPEPKRFTPASFTCVLSSSSEPNVPLIALDVYEHAYFLDYQTDRAAYIEAFLRNLDWGVVNGWVESYRVPTE